MTKRTRRNHSLVLNAKVALAALKGEKTIAQLADQFDVHVRQITQWKDQLQAGAVDLFEAGPGVKTEKVCCCPSDGMEGLRGWRHRA